MKTVILIGWFLITTHGQDEKHNYLLEDRSNNTFVAIRSDKPLPYAVGTWGKFKIEAECETVETTELATPNYMYSVKSRFCNANKFEILPCKKPATIGGVTYCE